MKKTKLHILLCAACMTLGLSACMDDHDEPDTDGYLITSPIALGDTNYSIARLKADNDSLFSQINAFQQVEEDLILEGVVVANDEGGNLYQTLLVRDIDEQAGTDEAIVLAVKNTCLYPYFMLGQRIKVNLRGLYIGCYSKLPKIGQPYYTSSGNLRLGPILLQLCRTNVELIGEPDRDCPEMQPVELTASQLADWEADFSKRRGPHAHPRRQPREGHTAHLHAERRSLHRHAHRRLPLHRPAQLLRPVADTAP